MDRVREREFRRGEVGSAIVSATKRAAAAGVEVRDLRDCDLDRVYHEVLEPAFGHEELETLEIFRGAVEADGAEAAFGLCAVDAHGAPVGCIIFYPDPSSGILLLGYIATRSGRRSTGVGRLLYETSRDRWFADGQFEAVVAEVDDPRFFPDTGDISPDRRVAFYNSIDSELIVGPYFQPRIHLDAQRVYHMMLVLIHGTPRALVGPPRAIRSAPLVAFLEGYFAVEEEQTPEEASELQWLLDWYRERPNVELRPIGDFAACELPQPRT
jgi:GNAT superfamily N-acetyltransferase